MSRWDRIKSLFSKVRIVGTDLQGNVYMEEVGKGLRPRRSVKLKEQKYDHYSPESISPAWTRWLQGLSNEPPTYEELVAREQKAELLKQKVQQLEKREAEQQAQEQDDSAQGQPSQPQGTKAVDHASAPSFRPQWESSEEATSTGKTFQPASWQPKSGSGSKQNSP